MTRQINVILDAVSWPLLTALTAQHWTHAIRIVQHKSHIEAPNLRRVSLTDIHFMMP
jgi:hypothetical protein